MLENKDYIDFPVYKISDNSKGKLVKSNEFSHAYLTILIPENDNSSANLDFLKKIISALNISWESDCRIRSFQIYTKIDIYKILHEDKSKYILSFGFAPENFNSQAILNTNKWNKFNSFKMLLSFTLSGLKDNNVNKRILWNELQKEFNGK